MDVTILTIPQAAGICYLSRGTIWKYVKSGDLNASMTPGGQYRIHKDDLETFMRRKRMHPVAKYEPETKRILIVDDDPQVQRLLVDMLSRKGYKTEVADDGFDAGIKVITFKPGLVVLDLFMPGLDGFEVCKRIMQDKATSHIKILAITGFDKPETRERIMALGAHAYMTKPFDSRELFQNVSTLLKHKLREI